MTNNLSLFHRTKRHLRSRWIREVAWFDGFVNQMMELAPARGRR